MAQRKLHYYTGTYNRMWKFELPHCETLEYAHYQDLAGSTGSVLVVETLRCYSPSLHPSDGSSRTTAGCYCKSAKGATVGWTDLFLSCNYMYGTTYTFGHYLLKFSQRNSIIGLFSKFEQRLTMHLMPSLFPCLTS